MEQRILFCNIAWMKYYCGATEDDIPKGNLGYIRKYGTGEEIYNFYKQSGNCVHGYVATRTMADETAKNGQRYCRINIERISHEVQHDNEKGDFVKGVLVVFFAQKIIVGWYKNATVYRQMQEEECHGKKRCYNIEADYDNAKLIPVDERYFGVQSGRNRNSRFGFGQAPYWFADKEEAQDFVSKARKYIDDSSKEQ